MEKLVFQGKDGDSAEFYVLEQTRMSGVNYLLVTDSEEDDGVRVRLTTPDFPCNHKLFQPFI